MDRTQQAPTLTHEQREAWEKIQTRLCRAAATLRRARTRGDAIAIERAERSLGRAHAARTAFCEPLTAGLYAPTRVRATFESRWTSRPDEHGNVLGGRHVHVVEMVLNYRCISGPQYRAVRVISDEGGPPAPHARPAPTTSGVAWSAVRDLIASGRYVVLDGVAP